MLTESGLLRLWEEGLGSPPARRALILAAAADGDRLSPAAVGDLPLGHRNALLLGLRERCFGPVLPCAVTCPACQESLDVTVTADEIRADSGGPAGGPELRVDGLVVALRALTSADLLAVDPSAPGARRALVSRCILAARPVDGEGRVDWRPRPRWPRLTDGVLDAVAVRLGELDPQADPKLKLDCPECGHVWQSSIDIAHHLWAEIEAYAQRLLQEVCSLAARFGWTEADVLAVSPTRRRMYLEAGAE